MLVKNKEEKIEHKVTADYERFVNKTSEVQKSEWIDGKLVVQSPALKRHLSLSKHLTRLMSSHADRYDLGYVAFEKALINLQESIQNFEPDIVFFSKEKTKGMTDLTSMFEAPDFVVEILSKGTERNDRGVKYKNYEKYGVKEYWIVDAKQKKVEQYYLEGKKYKLLDILTLGDYVNSKTLSAFTIPVQALFDTYANLAELDRPVRNALTKQFGVIIDEKDKKLEEKDKKLEEKDKKLEEKDKQLKASISLMKTAKLSVEQIMQATKQSKEFIENC